VISGPYGSACKQPSDQPVGEVWIHQTLIRKRYEGLIDHRANPVTKKTDGFCLCRTNRERKSPCDVLITYDLADASARIIPLLAKQLEEIKDQLDSTFSSNLEEIHRQLSEKQTFRG
jgi:hypothetical protein